MTDPATLKATIRAHAKRDRAKLTDEDRDFASLMIFENAVREHYFQRANLIASYLPAADEVDTWPLIERAWRMKKRIFAPVVEKNRSLEFREIRPDSELQTNRFGLFEPSRGRSIPARRLDLVFTPVVAFDNRCNRVGMGGGFFDRTFSFQATRAAFAKPKLVGLAFDCQRVEQIPASPWDIRLFQIISESGAAC